MSQQCVHTDSRVRIRVTNTAQLRGCHHCRRPRVRPDSVSTYGGSSCRQRPAAVSTPSHSAYDDSSRQAV